MQGQGGRRRVWAGRREACVDVSRHLGRDGVGHALQRANDVRVADHVEGAGDMDGLVCQLHRPAGRVARRQVGEFRPGILSWTISRTVNG
jgi:hypothetical protein